MWILYGSSRFVDEDKVASFSSEQLGKDYIKKSKLKRQTWQHKFLKSSLLWPYTSAWVEWEDDCLIHDPAPPTR